MKTVKYTTCISSNRRLIVHAREGCGKRDLQLLHNKRAPSKLVFKALPASGLGSSTSSSSSSSAIAFLNRTHEIHCLEKHCRSTPRFVTVILGRRSCGKTALLEHYISSRGLARSKCYINGRRVNISSPSLLASHLKDSALPSVLLKLVPATEALATLPDVLGDALRVAAGAISSVLGKVKMEGGKEVAVTSQLVSAALTAFAGDEKDTPPLTAVMETYTEVLRIWQKAQASGQLEDSSPPLLVLDEAHVLMEWGEQYNTERRRLLRFFAAMAKGENTSHVLLASSECAFQPWLTEELGTGFSETFVIGEFSPEDGRQYLNKCLEADQADILPVSDADWEAVYQVCGGNAGDLGRAAFNFTTRQDWHAALSQVQKDVWGSMRRGYLPPPGCGYTAADYAIAVKAILDSPYKAVDRDQLTASLGGHQPLDAMLDANQLALRPYSDWALDIEPAAFGPRRRYTLVTAPSALHLYLMGDERGRILAALNPPTERHGAVSDQSSSSRSSSRTSSDVKAIADYISHIRSKIEGVGGVEEQLTQVSKAIRKVLQGRSEGWQDELSYLREEKQRLVKREDQLSEQLRLLHEEKLLLLRREDAG